MAGAETGSLGDAVLYKIILQLGIIPNIEKAVQNLDDVGVL